MSNLTNINVYSQNNWANISDTNDSDLNFVEAHVVVETYKSGTSWYRIYSDGWCEQGGLLSAYNLQTVNLFKSYTNTNYSVQVTECALTSTSRITTNENDQIVNSKKTISSFYLYVNNSSGVGVYWMTVGYIA